MYRSWCYSPSNKEVQKYVQVVVFHTIQYKEVYIHVRLKDFFIKDKETPVGVQVVVMLAIRG